MNPFKCAKEGNVKFFKAAEMDLIENSRDKNGNSVLSIAAKEGHLNCCQVIYKRCSQLLYESNLHGVTALHEAADTNRVEVVKFLIYARAKAECAAEDVEMGRMEEGNVAADSKLLMMVDDLGDTSLIYAVRKGHHIIAKLLIDADPSNQLLMRVYSFQLTALRQAARLGFDKVAKVLIDADPSNHLLMMIDKDKCTALHLAAIEGFVEVAKVLIDADRSNHLLMMDDASLNTALHLARDVEMAILLLSKAGSRRTDFLRRPNDQGKTAMQNDWILDIVFETDLDVAWTSLLPITSNFWSLFEERVGNLSVIPRALLDIVANIDHLDMVANKIEYWPACLQCVSKEGQNILHLATKFGAEKVVKLILGRTNIDVKLLNMQDTQGNTPLHLATLAGSATITLSLLYDQRVDKFIRNNQGQSALDAINFEYDKRRAGVYGLTERVDEKDLKDRSDFDLLVGALISTVSFTAGITVPGGYFDNGPNEGNAVLYKKLSFEAFVLSNTTALVLSLYAVFSHFCTRRLIKEESIMYQLKVATYCSLGAIFAMMVAFVTGSYAVLAVSNWLAIAVSIIYCCFFGFASRALWRMLNEQRKSHLSHRHRQSWDFSI